ncbi:sensor histidine kinase [Streptomyces glomeratus]|uniref:sensor histidine kinase n=1 Tax=Streptomyces glomeratus TaxID=284452 RepID=UPI001F3BD44A|nr:nitrate- and nitrite sensing domain-containing protein [Streptomyces glomeratus]MCF1507882.1 nitrate- and nitrite sensing domain-containing protein [Streptomyces glomeratus]
MRAPVQKKWPRRTGKQTVPERGASSESAGSGRATHVRNRLIVAVAVVAAAIAGAGAPSVIAASGQLNDSQNLVTLAGQTKDALTLAHSLADERDAVTAYVAAGRPKSQAPAEQQSARVDREIEDLRADPDLPAALRKDLDDVGSVRRAALVGKSSALEAHRAYSAVITELHALADQLAGKIPPRAGTGAYALAELDSAVQQAAAARGLLLAALNVPHTTQTTINPVTGLPTTTTGSSAADTEQRNALTAAAQQAAVRSDAAVADFRDNATKTAKTSYDSTVTGPEVTSAEKYLAALTDQPTLSDSDLGLSTRKVDAALSARVDLMRGVESSLYESGGKDLAQLRDDDVTALEIRIAVLGALLLAAVGVAMAMARSLTRPLAVLRLGSARVAADPAGEEPVKFTGRNDEFAQVVRSVNALHAHAVALQERLGTLEADRKHLVGQRQTMADERARLRAQLDEAAAHLELVRHTIHSTFVNLALRTLGLVERQLTVIEGLEEREQDPERLSTLFRLDHFATVMRRHSENLLVLAGAEHVQQHAGPVPLVDVVRAAVSEIERYERVRIAALPPHAHIAGFAADDLSHLVAELLENAASFSPPDVSVEVSGWLLESGEVMISVQDEGIGMTAERMGRLNARLADFDPAEPHDQESGEGLGLGLYVVARLAHRHGVRVQLREQKQGGVAAVVVLPKTLLAAAPAAAMPPAGASPVAGAAAPVSLPGADAEANSNVLSGRTRLTVREPQGDEDPLIAAAEQAVLDRSTEVSRNARDTDAPQDTARGETSVPAENAARAETAVPAETAVRDHGAVRDEDAVREAAPAQDAFAAHGEQPPADLPGPETTMELLLPSPRAEQPAPASAPDAGGRSAPDPYTIGPDTHERTLDEGEPAVAQASEEPEAPRLTAKGLPKRTPKISAPAPAPRQRAGGVDAEALRRRLGGFHRGATAGYRHAEAEIADRTGENRTPAQRPTAPPQNATPATAQDVEPSGGTVEEASS